MKNVLVLMHDDAGQEARFQAALDLTRALEGHLTCLDVAVLPAFAGDYVDAGGTALLMADEQQREHANRERMEARLKIEDLPYDWIQETGFLTACVRDAAALADVVVLNRKLDAIPYPDMRDLVGDLLKNGRPIVAVPEQARGFDAFGTALVAWDGSAAAGAALRAAVPLLKLAREVVLLEVDDGSLQARAIEAAEYLSRHDIKPVIRRESAVTGVPSTVLLEMAQALRASYVVMGGFGHRRFVEAVFGGVTRRMIDESPVPLFLAK